MIELENNIEILKRKICVEHIKRCTQKPYDYEFSKFYETELISKIKFFRDYDFIKNEIPIASTILTNDEWTLYTTESLIGKNNGELNKMNYAEIENFYFGNFKSTDKSKTNVLKITRKDNMILFFTYQTGAASMIPIYAIKTILDIYQKTEPELNKMINRINKRQENKTW